MTEERKLHRELLKAALQLHRTIMRVGKAKKPSPRRIRLTFRNKQTALRSKLFYLYGEERGRDAYERIMRKIAAFRRKKPRKLAYRDAHFNPRDRFTQKDVILITYPDTLRRAREAPLHTLKRFVDEHLKDVVSAIHLLPFYPSSGDRGFAVDNYKKVDKRFGSWEDITALSQDYKLMFDGVFNHLSTKSRWFRGYLKGDPLYAEHFIGYDRKDALTEEQLRRIVRPRTSDLLTKFRTRKGVRYVWTTFSPHQADLNYKEPRVLLRIIDVLLRYIRHGAALIRLDAVNYIWKEPGTSCVHLKQTHAIVQLFRDVLDLAAPSVSLVTETNVPHAHNIRYLGNGRNEAQMVYNFALSPLVLYTLYKGNARHLSRWAERLGRVGDYATYFNLLASHDGIGLMPAKRVLPQPEVRFLIREAKRRGSLVQYKSDGDGKKSAYELDITWWDALNNLPDEDEPVQLRRYLTSYAIALSLKGVPGIYIHSLFGTRNDYATVNTTKVARDINRSDLLARKLEKTLAADTMTARVFAGMRELLRAREQQKAFHPDAAQQILIQNDQVFSLLRTSVDGQERLLCLVNVTPETQRYTVDAAGLGLAGKLYDVLRRRSLIADESIEAHAFTVALAPYEIRWIRAGGIAAVAAAVEPLPGTKTTTRSGAVERTGTARIAKTAPQQPRHRGAKV